MTTPTCVLCPIYQPDSQPRHRDVGQTCDHCLHQLDRDLHAVTTMHARALDPDLNLDLADPARHADGSVHDALAQLLPMAASNPLSKQPRVSGSRERTIPINVRLHDLTAPARPIATLYELDEDQVGDLSVATVLQSWVTHWARLIGHLPPVRRDVAALVDWLRGRRMELIAAIAPDVGHFAYQLRYLRRALQSVLGDSVPRPAVMWGVPCRRCNAVSTLILDLDDPERYRECTGCGLLLTEGEYKRWLYDLVTALHQDERTSNVVES